MAETGLKPRMKLIRAEFSHSAESARPWHNDGGQALNGSGKRQQKSVRVADEYGLIPDDVRELLDEEELEFCLTSLSAVYRVLKKRLEADSSIGKNEKDAILNSKDSHFVGRLEGVMEADHSNPDLGLEQIASRMTMSPRQLQRRVKATTNQQPVEYLRAFRLRKARKLLRTGQQVGLVANEVGFSSPAYFTSCFKSRFGVTPSEYQQLAR